MPFRRLLEVLVIILQDYHIFAMIAFGIGEAEEPLFQYRVAPIPQRDGKADLLMAITHAGQAVFVPAVRP